MSQAKLQVWVSVQSIGLNKLQGVHKNFKRVVFSTDWATWNQNNNGLWIFYFQGPNFCIQVTGLLIRTYSSIPSSEAAKENY